MVWCLSLSAVFLPFYLDVPGTRRVVSESIGCVPFFRSLLTVPGTRREYDESEGDYECVTVLSDHTADVKSVRWLPNKDVLVSCRRVGGGGGV